MTEAPVSATKIQPRRPAVKPDRRSMRAGLDAVSRLGKARSRLTSSAIRLAADIGGSENLSEDTKSQALKLLIDLISQKR